MSPLKRISALFFTVTLLFIGLFACDLDVTTLPSQREVDSVEVVDSSVQNAYVMDAFDISSILLDVQEVGGDTRTVSLDSSYLDDDSAAAVDETGTHTLNGTYKEKSFTVEIRLVESERDLLLHTLYRLGVEDTDLEEDYETWLESIEGVSVTDAEVDSEGDLIISLSDGSTIDAGHVKGQDGEDGADGADGEDGLDGRGIQSVDLRDGDMLVFTYDDGSEEEVEINLDQTSSDIPSMVDRVRGAMVSVRNIQSDGGGSGSGVVYKDNGDGSYYLFTNQHVIEGYESLEVIYEHYRNDYVADGSSVEFIGSYEEADIAVIKFTPSFPVDTVDFADSYDVRTGENVYAYGSPQGIEFSGTLTSGVVSTPLRMMTSDNTYAAFIQSDAAISPGNSGGALLDENGDVIGMNTLKLVAEDIEGIGFALPSNTVKRMVDELEDSGSITPADLGYTSDSESTCGYDYGACVSSVDTDGTADALGLESGDAIVGYKQSGMDEFYTIYNEDYLFQAVMDTQVGTDVTIQYVRDGDTVEETVSAPMQ